MEHKEIKLIMTSKLLFYWLVLIVLEIAMQASRVRESSAVLSNCDPYNQQQLTDRAIYAMNTGMS